MLIAYCEEFLSANHIAEKTICGCNTGNLWLHVHDDSTFLELEVGNYAYSTL